MKNIPAPLFWLWATITLPVLAVGGLVTYQIRNIPAVERTVYQKVVVTPTLEPTATPSAAITQTPVLLRRTTTVAPVVTGGVK